MDTTTEALAMSIMERPYATDKIAPEKEGGYMTITLPEHEDVRNFSIVTDISHSTTLLLKGDAVAGDTVCIELLRSSEERIAITLQSGIYFDGELKPMDFDVSYPAYAEKFAMLWQWNGTAWVVLRSNTLLAKLASFVGNLADLQTTAKGSLVAAVNEVKNTAGGGEGDEIARVMGMAMEADSYELPLLCGQPQKLFGAGTPQEAIVPDNWRQFDPETEEGYNWNGVPTAIGQEYINTAVSSGGRYIAVRDGNYSLKWVNS